MEYLLALVTLVAGFFTAWFILNKKASKLSENQLNVAGCCR